MLSFFFFPILFIFSPFNLARDFSCQFHLCLGSGRFAINPSLGLGLDTLCSKTWALLLLGVILKTRVLCLIKFCSKSSNNLKWSWLYWCPFPCLQTKNNSSISQNCVNYKLTRNKRQIMLKRTQNVYFQWNSPSLGCSLISLQPAIMIQWWNQPWIS